MEIQRARQTSASVLSEAIQIRAGKALLEGDLAIPNNAAGLVIFAHGSGSSRHSPRNIQVAEALQGRGLGTLLFDLLTHEEEHYDINSGRYRFDIPLLGRRLVDVADFMKVNQAKKLNIGYFGASTGAAAALFAAAERPEPVKAIVSRGGRPDLAGSDLPKVAAPTLLIVGGHDTAVIALNREAKARMKAVTELVIIPGATHLFEEPGALDEVARLAGDWFLKHLPPSKT